MPQAVQLTENNVILIATKCELPIADVQAMAEEASEREAGQYMIFDYTAPGGYAPYLVMSTTLFDQKFRFVYGEIPNKFMPIVSDN